MRIFQKKAKQWNGKLPKKPVTKEDCENCGVFLIETTQKLMNKRPSRWSYLANPPRSGRTQTNDDHLDGHLWSKRWSSDDHFKPPDRSWHHLFAHVLYLQHYFVYETFPRGDNIHNSQGNLRVHVRHQGPSPGRKNEKGLHDCNSPMCTLSQNGYGDRRELC